MEELEIDLAALVREFLRRWIWLLLASILGFLAGKTATMAMTKKYSARLVFVPEDASSSGQMLSSLSLITGRMGLSGESETQPYLSHFEKFLKTRNFTSSLRNTMERDSALGSVKNWYGAGVLESESRFNSWASSCLKGLKKDGLYNLEAVSKDPELSYLLVRLAFKTFEERIHMARMETLEEDLSFVQGLVSNSKADMRRVSDDLRRFLERNRSATSPELQQVEQRMHLDLKLAEEKYVLAIKELETIKIKKEKKSGKEVLIETPYLDPNPVFPDGFRFGLGGGIAAFFLCALVIGFAGKGRWIVKRSRQA
jgi:hypothetical protein